MEYREIPVPPPLDRWVRCLWYLRHDRAGPAPVVPDGRLEIVVHRGEPFTQLLDDGTTRRQEAVMVSGQLTRSLRLAPTGRADIVGVRLRTAAARDLLGIALDRLTDRVIPLHDLAPGLARMLREDARDPERLARRLLEAVRHRADPRSGEAVRRLERGERVAAVANALAMSTRTLERRMLADTGLPPKVLQSVQRFRKYYAMLSTGSGGAGAALSAGYYDQSHANRDFRVMAGASPSVHFAGHSELARALLSQTS